MKLWVRKILAISFAIIIITPLIWVVISGLRDVSSLLNNPFSLDSDLSFENLKVVINLPDFSINLINSILLAILSSIIVIILITPISYTFSRYNFPYKKYITTISLFSTYLLAPPVLIFPYFKILSQFGIINSILGILITHIAFSLPFALSIGKIIYDSVPIEMEKIAIINNVNTARHLFFKIIFPNIKLQYIGLFILIFAISWKEFFYAFIISTDSKSGTLPVLLGTMYSGEYNHWGVILACSSLMILPALFLLILSSRIKFQYFLSSTSKE
ncbi:MAG: carbohydrate ABC transporter permease [Bacteroidetes bacterium]|nr:carbohydrate ABC transporter permease [Bacteroidota bacterium]MBU1115033.1 carbohydrate ABC transporter permease [Bacteroidota bacterium]MBU1799525.1 carbohydrate ABC transporter permease [Bacteroidota bacterium]